MVSERSSDPSSPASAPASRPPSDPISSRPPGSRPSRPSGRADAPWSSAADRVAVVVNGRAKQVTEPLVQLLDQIVQSGDLFVSRSLDEGRDIARIIVERGYPTVLTGGGDGTFVQMVSWIAKLADARGRPLPRFGLLKLGTGNAMAWVLGAQYKKGRGVVADLARLRSEGGSRELRLIEVEGLLTPFGGLGADAITLEYHSQIRDLFQRTPVLKHASHAALTYSVAIAGRTMPQFLMGKAPRFRIYNAGASAYRVSHDNNPADAERYESGALLYDGPATLLAFSTIPYWGLGARIFPFCEDREDRFNLRVASFGSVVALTHLKSIWQGTYRGKRLQDFLVDAIRIECDRPTPLQIGGDVVGMRESVEARLSPRPIRVVDFYSPPPV